MLQDFGETDHPGCELNVDIGEIVAEEEWPFGIGCFNNFGYLLLEFLGVFGLFLEFLGLEDAVKEGDEFPVDLHMSV